MTKIVILGQEPEEKEKKKIEFVGCLMANCVDFNYPYGYKDIKTKNGTIREPKSYDTILLVSRGYELDIMVAYNDDNPMDSDIMLGQFNDGVV